MVIISLADVFIWCKNWSIPELLSLTQCSLCVLDDTDLSWGPAESTFWLLWYIWSFSLSHIFSATGWQEICTMFWSLLGIVHRRRATSKTLSLWHDKQSKPKKTEKKISNTFKWHLQTWVKSIFSEISRQQPSTTAASYRDWNWNDSARASTTRLRRTHTTPESGYIPPGGCPQNINFSVVPE